MLDRLDVLELEDAKESEWDSLTKGEKSLIRLFRGMPEHEQRRVLRVTEALALSNPYAPVWSATEKI